MQIKTNRWTEVRTGYKYVGCCGYDDPVYEDYEYVANCSEQVVVFDDAAERKAYHNMIVNLKPKATEVANKIANDIEAWVNNTYEEKQAKYKQLCNKMARAYGSAPWYKKIFMDKQPSEWSKPPSKKFIRDNIKGKALFQLEVASWILNQPEKYSFFDREVTADEYKKVINFSALNASSISEKYSLSKGDD